MCLWSMASTSISGIWRLHNMYMEQYIYSTLDVRLCGISQWCTMFDWGPDILSIWLFYLQDCLCLKKQQLFWSSPPGSLWPVHSILHLFSHLFWETSAWSVSPRILSTLHCSTPTWNRGEQFRKLRKKPDRKCCLWNVTNVPFLPSWNPAGFISQYFASVYMSLHSVFSQKNNWRFNSNIRISISWFSIQKLCCAAATFVYCY